jgi:phosphoglycerate dehydrogenase-like enzyme
MENVLITPHVGGAGGDMVGYGRFAARFSENLRRLKAGEALLFQVAIEPAAP